MMKRSLLVLVTLLTTLSTAGARAPARRIDLDVVGADVRDVLRLLADVRGINLVIGDDVTGRVTIKLRRVRWEHALDVILRTRGLEAERLPGNILRVAPRQTLAAERAALVTDYQRCLAAAPLQT